MAPTDPASDATAAPKSDLAVARASEPRPIADVAADLGLDSDDVKRRGEGIAKLTHAAVRDAVGGVDEPDGTTVLVTGMSPTPKGGGKTVTSVGLGQGSPRSASGPRSLSASRRSAPLFVHALLPFLRHFDVRDPRVRVPPVGVLLGRLHHVPDGVEAGRDAL